MPNPFKYAKIAVLLALVAPFVLYAVPALGGMSHSYVVLSDSMSPAIGAGDVVYVDDAPTDRVEAGDVITFERPGDGETVTHRVTEVVTADGTTQFRTKGDANEEVDARLVPEGNVVGVVRFHVPLIGHVVTFASTSLGTGVLVVVPFGLLALDELRRLVGGAAAPDGVGPTEREE